MLNKTNERNVPTENKIQNELYQHKIQPYIVISNEGQKCCITEQTAIHLINKYCMSLIKSKFTCLSPIWILYKILNNTINNCIQYRVLYIYKL